jgi:hypothetical protein
VSNFRILFDRVSKSTQPSQRQVHFEVGVEAESGICYSSSHVPLRLVTAGYGQVTVESVAASMTSAARDL